MIYIYSFRIFFRVFCVVCSSFLQHTGCHMRYMCIRTITVFRVFTIVVTCSNQNQIQKFKALYNYFKVFFNISNFIYMWLYFLFDESLIFDAVACRSRYLMYLTNSAIRFKLKIIVRNRICRTLTLPVHISLSPTCLTHVMSYHL